MSGLLAGRRALVTGASRGIGAAVAAGLAAEGADVVLSGRDSAALESVAGSLPTRTAIIPADLADAGSVEALARAALDAFDGLDILVNNAGITFPELARDLTVSAWDATMAVNLRAPALLGARIGAAMAADGGGSIVNIASLAGLRALTEHYAYSASKAALIMATKVLALELGPSGVRANVLCPTVVLTEMGQQVWAAGPVRRPVRRRGRGGLARLGRLRHGQRRRDSAGRRLHGRLSRRPAGPAAR
jgi:NAD(P)-dependent dehydrogenase (short-subunit alcohol dehydrogenase family)